MYDCEHRIFHVLCTVCWYKKARGVFRRSCGNPIIYDSRIDFFKGNIKDHSNDCKCGHCGDDRRYYDG